MHAFGPRPLLIASLFAVGIGAALLLPERGWILGVPLLAVETVWIWKSVGRARRWVAAREERYDRRGQLLSTLAHELRTPLTVIRSSASILLEDPAAEPLTGDQQRFVRSIFGNAHRLEALTENVLAGLKIESWSDSLRLRPVDLRREVGGVTRNMEPVLATRGQRIHYMFPSLLSRALADPQWIGQVLVNLVHNASKYTEDGGTIDMTVKENERFLVVSVSDNGSGLPARRRPDVFAEYVQGRPEAAESLEGTGLGLAIVKRVIALHGGDVYVASRPDGGTTVSFTLKKAGGGA